MITRAHFAFRIDRWDQLGDNILDHVAGIEDFQVAQATFERRARDGRVKPSLCGRATASSRTAARPGLPEGEQMTTLTLRYQRGHFTISGPDFDCVVIYPSGAGWSGPVYRRIQRPHCLSVT